MCACQVVGVHPAGYLLAQASRDNYDTIGFPMHNFIGATVAIPLQHCLPALGLDSNAADRSSNSNSDLSKVRLYQPAQQPRWKQDQLVEHLQQHEMAAAAAAVAAIHALEPGQLLPSEVLQQLRMRVLGLEKEPRLQVCVQLLPKAMQPQPDSLSDLDLTKTFKGLGIGMDGDAAEDGAGDTSKREDDGGDAVQQSIAQPAHATAVGPCSCSPNLLLVVQVRAPPRAWHMFWTERYTTHVPSWDGFVVQLKLGAFVKHLVETVQAMPEQKQAQQRKKRHAGAAGNV